MEKSIFLSSVLMRNIFLITFFVIPTIVFGDNCTCEPEKKDGDKTLSLRYKAAAISSILAASAVGVCLPEVGKRVPALSPDRDFFFVVKAFAAGVILSTGFIHVLPDAFDKLTSSCISKIPWGDFPITGFIAMVAAIGTLMVDTYATAYYRRRTRVKAAAATVAEGGVDEERAAVPVHTHATHGHAHGSVPLESDSGETELLRHRVISQVLELGIIVHSVIIGIALGASESLKKIRVLTAALTFHQFFEGIGLGGCITQAKFNSCAVAIMVIFFSLTTPVGIGIGIALTDAYSKSTATTFIIEGVFNAASAGILIYMALVDLLAADFMSPKLQSNGKLQLCANVSLLIGAGCMSLLGYWA